MEGKQQQVSECHSATSHSSLAFLVKQSAGQSLKGSVALTLTFRLLWETGLERVRQGDAGVRERRNNSLVWRCCALQNSIVPSFSLAEGLDRGLERQR